MMHRKEHVLQRRARVATLYCQGRYQSEIAEEVGCSQQQVSSDLRMLRAEWQQSASVDTETARARELQRIEHVERESWQGYARSRLTTEKRTVKERAPGGDRVSITTEKRAGDRGWLDVILRCCERRANLLGLDATRKYTVNLDALSDAQLEAIVAGHPIPAVLAMSAPAPMAEA